MFQVHTFTTLGVHEVSVNFSNAHGSVLSTMSVIVVSRGIHNVTVTAPRTTLRMWESTRLEVSVVTSTRYFTYIEIDLGDGTVAKGSAVDPVIANMEQLLK